MTAKEKAIELYNKFRNEFPVLSANIRAKKCALICVNEVLDSLNKCYSDIYEADLGNTPKGIIEIKIDYYEEVKQEIEKL